MQPKTKQNITKQKKQENPWLPRQLINLRKLKLHLEVQVSSNRSGDFELTVGGLNKTIEYRYSNPGNDHLTPGDMLLRSTEIRPPFSGLWKICLVSTPIFGEMYSFDPLLGPFVAFRVKGRCWAFRKTRHYRNSYPLDQMATTFVDEIFKHIFVNENITISLDESWWRHQMEIFSALLAICAGNSPVTNASDAELWCFLWSAPE